MSSLKISAVYSKWNKPVLQEPCLPGSFMAMSSQSGMSHIESTSGGRSKTERPNKRPGNGDQKLSGDAPPGEGTQAKQNNQGCRSRFRNGNRAP